MSSKYNKGVTNTFYGIIFNLLNVIVTIVITPLMVNEIGKFEWANYSLLILILSILSFIEVSIQSYFLQSNINSRLNNAYYNSFRDYTVILNIAIVYLIIYFLKYYLFKFESFSKNSIFLNYNLVLSISFLRSIVSIFKGYFQSEVNQKILNLGQNIFSILRPVILIITLMFYSVNINLIIKVYFIITIIECLYYILFYKLKKYKSEKNTVNCTRYEGALINLLLSNLLSVIYSNIDKVIFLITSSYLIFGEYNIAASLSALLYLGVNSIITSFTPIFKELYFAGKKRKLILLNIKLNQINIIFIIFAISIFYFNSDLILKIFSKDINFKLIINCFLILSITVIINSLNWIPGAISLTANKNGFNILSNIINIIFFLLCNFSLPNATLKIPICLLISSLFTNMIMMLYFRSNIIKLEFIDYYKKIFILPFGFLLTEIVLGLLLKNLIINNFVFLIVFVFAHLIFLYFLLIHYKRKLIRVYFFLQNKSITRSQI